MFCLLSGDDNIQVYSIQIQNESVVKMTPYKKTLDNLTTAAVQPILNAISGNLTGVQDSIQQAQAMVDELAFLEQGFSQV